MIATFFRWRSSAFGLRLITPHVLTNYPDALHGKLCNSCFVVYNQINQVENLLHLNNPLNYAKCSPARRTRFGEPHSGDGQLLSSELALLLNSSNRSPAPLAGAKIFTGLLIESWSEKISEKMFEHLRRQPTELTLWGTKASELPHRTICHLLIKLRTVPNKPFMNFIMPLRLSLGSSSLG